MLQSIWQASHHLRSATRSALRFRRSALLSTQSGDDAQPPTALTRLYLEDGTVLTGKSFGCHESVDGEVRTTACSKSFRIRYLLEPSIN
jgi:hypothetical protein